jgi:chemosensory pili system protein ChpA (sensor histidine kinase/response regulator)
MTMSSNVVDWGAVVGSKTDNIDSEMIDIFVEEADERFAEIDRCIGALSGKPSDKKQANTLKRIVHTLKGSANTTGARKIGAIFHHLEDLLERAPVITADLLDLVQTGVDIAHTAFLTVQGKGLVDQVARDSVSAMPSSKHSVASTTTSNRITSSVTTQSDTSFPSTENIGSSSNLSSITPHESSPATGDGGARPERRRRNTAADNEQLRVSTRTVDAMSKVVAEINMNRAHVAQQAAVSKASLAGLSASTIRLSALLHEVELEAEKQMFTGTTVTGNDSAFDALQLDKFSRLQELTRRVAEAQNDILAQQAATSSAMREITDALSGQATLIETVTAGLNRVRQVKVSSIMEVMRRVVRAACRDTGKQSDIFFDADVEIDRSILEKAGPALEHILRNAIAHGIEDSNIRLGKGKDPNGTIEFRAYYDGGDVVIEIRDDGAGIDSEKVLRRATARGLVRDGATLAETEIFELLFEPGFSTAENVTDIAGRGVGLDVVRSDVAAMGGRVRISSVVGAGTSFSLRLPATLTMIIGLPVTWGVFQYVIPVTFIDTIARAPHQDIAAAYATRTLSLLQEDGSTIEYDFFGLGELIGAKTRPATGARGTLLLLQGERTAVHVERTLSAAEFTFRSMGPQIAPAAGVIGSTISVNGIPGLVIDVARVARIYRSLTKVKGMTGLPAPNAQGPLDLVEPLVLVVDDSVTVREITSRLLKRNGYRVATAENGKEALERMRADTVTAVVLDLEMPVMDGYETLQAIRASQSLRSTPVIMITSRVGDKHRQMAMDLGVNAYLGKPYVEKELLEHIAQARQGTSAVTI